MSTVEVRSSGETHALAVGDELVVRLVEPATSGYAWQVAGQPGPQLELVDSSLDAGEPGSGAPGAAARRTLRLAARAPGSTRLTLELRRPWESAGTDRFDVDVTVT